jgi:hypothetical protein
VGPLQGVAACPCGTLRTAAEVQMSRRLLRLPAVAFALGLAPAAHAAGAVTVRSDMAGQSVVVDGADIGMITPASVQGLSAGPHVIKVVGGCRVGEASVDVKDGETVPVLIETRRTPGSLVLDVSPEGAAVHIDGTQLASVREPQALACGAHTISVSMPGHLPTLINVDMQAGEMLTLPIKLMPQGRGKLTLDVTPDDALVLLDGAEIGQGDLSRFTLLAGPHMLRAEAEGYEAGERQFVLADGVELDIAIPLEPLPGTIVAVAPAPDPASPTGPAEPAEPVAPAGPAGPGWSKARITGVSVAAVGAGVGVVAVVQLARMGEYAGVYQGRADEVLATNDASVLAPAYANNYREDTLLPQRNRAVTSTVLATALLATGVTLTVAF